LRPAASLLLYIEHPYNHLGFHGFLLLLFSPFYFMSVLAEACHASFSAIVVVSNQLWLLLCWRFDLEPCGGSNQSIKLRHEKHGICTGQHGKDPIDPNCRFYFLKGKGNMVI
jgi:hypothetical protein